MKSFDRSLVLLLSVTSDIMTCGQGPRPFLSDSWFIISIRESMWVVLKMAKEIYRPISRGGVVSCKSVVRKSRKSKPFVADIDKVKICYEEQVGRNNVDEPCVTQVAVLADASTESTCVADDREESFCRPRRRVKLPRRFIEET